MKCDQMTINERVEAIYQLKTLGALPTDVRRHAEEKGWNVSERQLQRYTARAEEMLAAAVEKNKDRLLAHHFTARRALFARAMAVSDYRTAPSALRDEAELFGLYPPKGLALAGKDGGPVQLHIVEEITTRPAPAGLPGIIEEVVSARDRDGNTTDATEGPASPGAEGLPPV
jgi:hypothetical protein